MYHDIWNTKADISSLDSNQFYLNPDGPVNRMCPHIRDISLFLMKCILMISVSKLKLLLYCDPNMTSYLDYTHLALLYCQIQLPKRITSLFHVIQSH
jgi:hypothetical protein